MKKTMNKFFSLVLALSMVCGMISVPVYAAPVEAEPLVIVDEADVAVDTEVVEETEAVEEVEAATEEVVEETTEEADTEITITDATVSEKVEVGNVGFSMKKFNEKLVLKTDELNAVKTDVEIDMDDPAIKTMIVELKEVRVMNAEG